MATAYTPILQLALPVTGELQGTWGTVVNDNITSMIEQAIAGLATINTWTTASHTLTTANGTTSEARCAVLECSGAPGATATVICPTSTKLYVIKNSVTGGYAVTLKTSAGTGISVPNGSTALLYCDGTNVVSGATYMATVSTTQVDILAQGDLRLQDSTGGEYVALQSPATLSASYTLTLPVDDGTAGQALVTDGSGVLSWSTAASGDVYGPASATDNAVARFDGTTGKIIQNSAVTIADDGATVIAANSASDGLRITQLGAGNALVVEDSANPDATPFVVTADGNVGLGTTTPLVNFHAQANTSLGVLSYTAGGGTSFLNRRASGTTASPTIVVSGDTIAATSYQGYDGASFITAASILANVDGTPGTNDMPGRLVFSTTADGASSPTERMRIDSAGGVGIGATSLTGFNLRVSKSLTGATSTFAVRYDGTIQSDVTNTAYLYSSQSNTQASAFALSSLQHYTALQGTIGASSSITSQFGFVVDSGLTGATYNYGFYSGIASGTNRWNFYANGTAANYFAGNTSIGTTNTPATLTIANGNAWFRSSGAGDQKYTDINADGTNFDLRLLNDAYAAANTAYRITRSGFTVSDHIWYTGSSTERMRIASTGTISLGAAPGSESLRVTPVGGAVNYLNALGAAAGANVSFAANGSDTNISIAYTSKGNGSQLFYSNNYGSLNFSVAHTASAVNYMQASGGATGNNVSFSAAGTDTNIGIDFASKGFGSLRFFTGGNRQFNIADTASAVNYLQVAGGATGFPVTFSAQGSDANIQINHVSKGTGNQVFIAGTTTQFVVATTASSVNYLNATGAATGSAPSIFSGGSDTNVDIALYPQGTGVLRFGTYTAGALSATGYITIKDAAGNTRRLLVG